MANVPNPIRKMRMIKPVSILAGFSESANIRWG
jgi:hypothetical protein